VSGAALEGRPSVLGAPGPENLQSPVVRNGSIAQSLYDPRRPAAASPNRVRDTRPVTDGAHGTISFQRRYTNNTGAPVTELRFRIVNLTTLGAPGYSAGGEQSDLRVLSSTGTVTERQGDVVAVLKGTTLDAPPAQYRGGGWNSTVRAGTVTMSQPLAPGASVDLQFLFGVEQKGSFRFVMNVEAKP
jgi:hypothetical protein